MFGGCPWEACAFLREGRGAESVREGRWEGRDWGRGRRGNCSQSVIYEIIIFLKNLVFCHDACHLSPCCETLISL